MKSSQLMTFLVSVLLSSVTQAESKVWNRNWRFRRADQAAWQVCHLPHSFSAPYFLGPDFYTGDGFYEKTLTAEETTAEHLFLDFEAAFQFADVQVNGKLVKSHASGYTGFRADLTPALGKGKPAIVKVRVNNEWNPVICPRAGEHVFSGGIYRNVHLVSEGKAWIDFNGLKVTTPVVSAAKGMAEARVKVCGKGATQVQFAFNGKKVTQKVVAPCEVRQTFDVQNPRLWSPESPALYPLTVKVDRSEATAKVGFRTLQFTKDKGFFLNGQHYFLLGANVHQDHAGWGDGVTAASARRDVQMIKDAGFNFIRGSHYPHSKAFLDACDEIGILFWSEGGIWGMGGCKARFQWWNTTCIPPDEKDQPAFLASAETLVREMIDDAYNHPCVLAWSVCNEPFFVDPMSTQDASRQMIRHLLAVAREADPTRAAAVGGAQRGGFDSLGCDVIGYNGDGATLFRNPPAANLVAEYGSPVNVRPGKFDPAWSSFGNDRPAWRSGAAIWCGFDHGSIWENGSRMGIVDYFRLPKAIWYWYRDYLTGQKPAPNAIPGKATRLVLTAEKTILAACDGTDDTQLIVRLEDDEGRLIDEPRAVTLTVLKGPGEFPTGRSITFAPKGDIDLRAGLAAIELRANFAGETIIQATSEGLKPVELRILSKAGTCTDPDVQWVEGKSARTPDRPYKGRYRRNKTASTSAEAINLALNRPCLASSNVAQANRASDGDEKTAWKPAANDNNPWFIQDLEFSFPVKKIEPVGQGIKTIEVSKDGKTFVPQGQIKDVHQVRITLEVGGYLSEIRVY